MESQYKPEGYNSASPYLMVKDAPKLIEMLSFIFDGEEKRKFLRGDGSIMHAEIQIDDSIIMCAQATEDYPAYSLWMHVYVPNVDEVFQKAIDYGCEVISQPIQKEGDPDRRGTFKDAEGIYWAVGTQVE